MIQNFVLIDSKGDGCKLEQKLKNLKEAKVELPIIADSALWQIQHQLKDTNQKLDLERQTKDHMVFFITDNEAL